MTPNKGIYPIIDHIMSRYVDTYRKLLYKLSMFPEESSQPFYSKTHFSSLLVAKYSIKLSTSSISRERELPSPNPKSGPSPPEKLPRVEICGWSCEPPRPGGFRDRH